MKIIILAGGGGSRLWPMSRKNEPKQFYKIISDQPMIVDTYSRFIKDFKKEDIYFACEANTKDKVKELFPDTPPENVIVEPERRDTGPAMGYTALNLSLKFSNEPIAFIPSDHYIAQVSKFIKSLKVAEQLIKKTGKMLDIAIRPSFPSTILGYTQIGEKYQELDNIDVYHFKSHTEKPNFETAKKYLEAGNYLWHANFYMWTPRLFLEAYKKYAPRAYEILMKIKECLESGNKEKIPEYYSQLEKTSIDYLITEKIDASNVLIIKGEFDWSDIGGWDVLFDRLAGACDQNGNILKGDCLALDTNNTLIYGSPDKVIATIGLNDMIVVDTGDALLICPSARAQEIKKIVEELKKGKREKYL